MATPPMSSSHLLTIPPEARNLIYKYTFGRREDLQALLTCRQIHNEAAVLAFAATQFEFKFEPAHHIDPWNAEGIEYKKLRAIDNVLTSRLSQILGMSEYSMHPSKLVVVTGGFDIIPIVNSMQRLANVHGRLRTLHIISECDLIPTTVDDYSCPFIEAYRRAGKFILIMANCLHTSSNGHSCTESSGDSIDRVYPLWTKFTAEQCDEHLIQIGEIIVRPYAYLQEIKVVLTLQKVTWMYGGPPISDILKAVLAVARTESQIEYSNTAVLRRMEY